MSGIIAKFIQNEDNALAAKEQGNYFAENHHRIKSDFKRVFKKLDPETLLRFYYHSFRLGEVASDVSIETWPSFLKAIELVKIHLKNGDRYPICNISPYESLFLFGSDGIRIKEPEASFNLQIYRERLDVLKKARQYTSIPGMLSKLDKLKVFTENESLLKHIHFVFRNSEFIHNGIFASELTFWCPMAIILIKNDEETKRTIDLFRKAAIPEKVKHMEFLNRLEEAVTNCESNQ